MLKMSRSCTGDVFIFFSFSFHFHFKDIYPGIQFS